MQNQGNFSDEDQDTYLRQRPSLHLVKAYVLKSLMLHFSRPDLIEFEPLRELKWMPDTANKIQSKILITTLGSFNPANMGQRPALVVRKQASRTEPAGAFMGRVQGSLPLMGEDGIDATLNGTVGDWEYEHMTSSKISIACIHTDEAVAEQLGEEVQGYMAGFAPIIMSFLHLHKFFPYDVTEAQPLEESNTHWMCRVDIDVALNKNITVRSNAPLLKAISLFRQI